jgi:putative acyl-CoA dehydrogenase
MTPVVKYWVCKSAPGFLFEAMESLGGNGYVEDGVLARHYREAPVNAIWEGSGNVMCLDVLRALAREPDAAEAVLQQLVTETRGLAGAREAANVVISTFRAADAERAARNAVETLALLAAAAALNAVYPRHAELFAQTRLKAAHRGIYGGADLSAANSRSLLERALPA